WDSQNAWLRQIIADNHLYMNTRTAAAAGLADDDWIWVESHHGALRCQLRTMEGCEPNTVWTWNAVAKQPGAWALQTDAPEATSAFLLNHLIPEHLPGGAARFSNSDPVTGQAAWFDLRVRVRKCAADETGAWPKVAALPEQPVPERLRWGAA
ncbi:MAG: molybdopterin dinucleotide binding domain-containing protein, partial [Betaproteobacteria bacterium]